MCSVPHATGNNPTRVVGAQAATTVEGTFSHASHVQPSAMESRLERCICELAPLSVELCEGVVRSAMQGTLGVLSAAVWREHACRGIGA